MCSSCRKAEVDIDRTMAISLEPEQRDTLFSQVSVDLGLIDDLQAAMSRGDEEECYRLGRRVSEALRLVVEGGVGWKERTAEATVLKLPDAEIRRTVTRMHQDARAGIEYKRPDHEESQAEWDELMATKAACQAVLDQARA
jgi:hypothetical protein